MENVSVPFVAKRNSRIFVRLQYEVEDGHKVILSFRVRALGA